MRLKISSSKNSVSYYVQKDVKKGLTRSTIIIEKLGTEKEIMDKYGVSDAKAWAQSYVDELNRKEKEEMAEIMPVSVTYHPDKLIDQGKQNSYNAGYLFLKDIYSKLGLTKICKSISSKYKFKFDLNDILQNLIYTRILFPGSKLSSLEDSRRFLEQPGYELHDIYRALDVLSEESDYIQTELYKNSTGVVGRKTGILYYDCTNYFFETEEPDSDGLRQYGKSKEHRPSPIVQMGLFLDASGIPLAFNITPGNTNEQTTLIPLEKKILKDFGVSKFVCCTDAGLSSKTNRKYNNVQERAYITTFSLKKTTEGIRMWALDNEGWKLDESDRTYTLDEINSLENHDLFFDKIFYKSSAVGEIRNEKADGKIESGLEGENIIVTYSLKYRQYNLKIRNNQIERAEKAISQGIKKLEKKSANDFRRFIGKTSATSDGEVADIETYYIDEDKVVSESRYDGFYAVVTSLDDEPREIAKINKQRWQIEECFRIMKTEFEARPVYVSRSERIKAHFLTCFIALLVYKVLDKKLEEEYSVEQLIKTLTNFNLTKTKINDYIPAFTRTAITDKLHEIAGFRLDYEINTEKNVKKILKNLNNRKI